MFSKIIERMDIQAIEELYLIEDFRLISEPDVRERVLDMVRMISEARRRPDSNIEHFPGSADDIPAIKSACSNRAAK